MIRLVEILNLIRQDTEMHNQEAFLVFGQDKASHRTTGNSRFSHREKKGSSGVTPEGLTPKSGRTAVLSKTDQSHIDNS